MYHFLERASVRSRYRLQGAIGRIAKGKNIFAGVICRHVEKPPASLLIAH
jgi:hypothetical protein